MDWTDPITGESMGTPRKPGEESKASPLFAEITINAPKSLSVAAALDQAQQGAIRALGTAVIADRVENTGR